MTQPIRKKSARRTAAMAAKTGGVDVTPALPKQRVARAAAAARAEGAKAPALRKQSMSRATAARDAARWDEVFARHADFCLVFSDPKRLRIMWLLGEREECAVGEIAAHLGASMQNTSQHLRVMRDKGAVRQRRAGQTVYYSISNHKFLDGCRLIRAGVLEELNIEPPAGPDPGAGGGRRN